MSTKPSASQEPSFMKSTMLVPPAMNWTGAAVGVDAVVPGRGAAAATAEPASAARV